MDRSIIEKYIMENERVSIPEIQCKFSLGYKETRTLFQELENKKMIKPEEDIYYTVLSQGSEDSLGDEPRKDNGCDGLSDLQRRRVELEHRRRELFRRMEASLKDEDDDDEDEEDDDDEDEDEENEEVEEGNTAEEFQRRRTLAKTVTAFGDSGRFTREGKDYFCSLGITYSDDTEMQFKLSYEDKITLSDCGRTYQFMSKYFNMADEDLLKRIGNIMDDYALGLREENGGSELYIQIRDENSAFTSFLWLFAAIERISNLQRLGE